MYFDLDRLSGRETHKLMTATIVPRPIAWVTTLNEDQTVNAAPFSFFNMFSGHPAIVCIGVGGRGPGCHKDTLVNTDRTGQFVVNLVSEDVAEQMNVTAIDFPYGTDELQEAGLTRAASVKVTPPRIAESVVSFECSKRDIYPLGGGNSLIIGEVLALHIRDDAVIDAARCHVDTARLRLIGRMHGGGMYVRLSDTFEMPRLTRK
jgi:flavin reductase (DIM6/NTAB) family NADH-FMN oxidoreductase RutF